MAIIETTSATIETTTVHFAILPLLSGPTVSSQEES